MTEKSGLSFDLHPARLYGGEFIVLEIVAPSGKKIGCRWEKAANAYQVAAALERLARALRSEEEKPG